MEQNISNSIKSLSGKTLKITSEFIDLNFKTLVSKNEIVRCIGVNTSLVSDNKFDVELLRFGVEDAVTITVCNETLEYFEVIDTRTNKPDDAYF